MTGKISPISNVIKNIKIQISRDEAYKIFVYKINLWWPKSYTWSQDELQEIRIDATVDGLCTEIGPYGFRCDWGRVTDIAENEHIILKWQISARREPIPNPSKASEVSIAFSSEETGFTNLKLKHSRFDNHGEEAKSYAEMMDSEYGWYYILNCYKRFCNKSTGSI